MPVDIYVGTKELKSIQIKLGDLQKQTPGATASALNRTLSFAYMQIGREVSKEYEISAAKVKKTLYKHPASKSKLYAYISSVGRTLSLGSFPFSPKQVGTKRQIKVKIKRQEGFKPVKTDPKAFTQRTGGEGTPMNVFRRLGPKRLPITVLRTLSVPQMIGEEKIMNRIQDLANKKLQERIDHEINWRLEKAAGKVKS
ncbi:MAG: phage tail protein [Clostridiales bacterium]|jgi:hypothetical protein|nr:phage tail protein [Eubacteriales bacterium]MDH7566861.1 phage tail protein [Clostridiales bacterium]